jgi:hypothetical protein
MRKLILVLILIMLFLTGCSSTIPNDTEFMQVVEGLNTPEKIAQYMYFNFEYEYQAYGVKTPLELFNLKKGDCNDFSNWIASIGYYHGYETYQLRMIFDGVNHWLGIFDMGNYLIYTDNQFINTTPYNSFEEIAEFYSIVSGKKLIDYEVYNYELVRME